MEIPTWQERLNGAVGDELRPSGAIEHAMQAEIDDCRKEITRLENKYEKGTDIELPMSRDPMYNVWRAIISRCTNEKDPGYKNYGGRGVKICDSWMKDFYKFKTDVGFPPNTSVNMSLDRIDTCGNYEPENIRWSDSFTQNRNTRVQSNNTTGHKGVSNFNGRYRASISVSGKFISLGVFDTIAEAVAARQEGEVFHWGDSDKTKCGLSVRVGISDFDEESRKEHDALRAENAELRAALAQPCKYNQAAETCTLAPMDCQCAIDAVLVHPQASEPAPCDAGAVCLDCQPRNADGSCPDAAPQPPPAETPKPCTWTEDADGYYSTECGECFAFNEGTPAQNKAYFCHHCGGKIEVKA